MQGGYAINALNTGPLARAHLEVVSLPSSFLVHAPQKPPLTLYHMRALGWWWYQLKALLNDQD